MSETSTWTPLHASGTLEERRASHVLNAARAAVTASETISRKPIATTRPKERRRSSRECLQVRTRIRLHTPHRVQRGLELEERTGRGDDKCDAADRGGDDARPSLTRSIEKALYGARTLAPDQVIELADDLSAHRLGVEDETGDPSGDQQDGRDREQRVVGQ